MPARPKLPKPGLLFLQPLAPKGSFGQKKLLFWGVWGKKKPQFEAQL